MNPNGFVGLGEYVSTLTPGQMERALEALRGWGRADRELREMSSERWRVYRDVIRNHVALFEESLRESSAWAPPLEHTCGWCGGRAGARPIRVHNKRTCNACLDAMNVEHDDEDEGFLGFTPLDIF
jgi:hypothetical protein